MLNDMADIFSTTMVSVYDGVKDSTGRPMTLEGFLSLADQCRTTIDRIRATTDKDARRTAKAGLPCATLAGVFTPHRKASMLATPSNLICIDVDDGDSPWYDYPDLLRYIAEISEDPQEAGARHLFASLLYADLSVSGRGIFCVHRLPPNTDYAKAYADLSKEYFDVLRINPDPQCKDVTRLRFISYGRPLIHEAAVEYHPLPAIPKNAPWPASAPAPTPRPKQGDTVGDVYALCGKIAQRHVDLTQCYGDWVRIGMSLATLGEAGREAYHIISAQYPKYTRKETDRKFDNLLKTSHNIDISTFFYICKQNNITL